MKNQIVFTLSSSITSAILAFCFSFNVLAAEPSAAQALARQNNCFRCHGVDKEKDGPAWRKVAAKYKGDAKAEERLFYHLTSGEKAKFPDGHEEEHTIVKTDNADEIKNLVDWILSL